MDYIPGTATQKRTRKTKKAEYARVPEVWAPAHIRARTDFSEFYEKPPQEMSRYELEELEKIIKQAEEGEENQEQIEEGPVEDEYDADGNVIDKLAQYKQTEQFLKHRDEFRKLQPMRMNVFRRYWARFRYNKKRRERLIGIFNDSDEQFEFFLGDEFVPWFDELEVRDFLDEIEAKEVKDREEKLTLTGRTQNTVVRRIKTEHEETDISEIQYSTQTFNPFDQRNIKDQERKGFKVYVEKDLVGSDKGISDSHLSTMPKSADDNDRLTLGTTTPSEDMTNEELQTSEFSSEGETSEREPQSKAEEEEHRKSNIKE